jgi:hypothetical protein
MLRILKKKLEPEGLMPRIRTHLCTGDTIGLSTELDGQINVAFVIFVVHEVPDPGRLFGEILAVLVPGGQLFYTEPPFIVSSTEFRDNLALAQDAGFRLVETRWYFVNRAAVLRKD